MDTTIYEGIPREARLTLRALITLSQFTRKAILDALRDTGGLPPYSSELKKHEILMWVATYGDPAKLLMRAYENADGGA
jgi:hypothetical protein